jgi:succinate-semialdehyde dehydrogenase/glutarate-semialdehyde dehydrogenase
MAHIITERSAEPAVLSCIINGAPAGNAQQFIDVINPFDGSLLAKVAECGQADARAAVDAAAKAFPEWNQRTAAERSGLLRKWFDLIKANTQSLAVQLTLEQGKSITEAQGEISYAASFIEWFAEEGKRVYGETIPSPAKDKFLMVVNQPVGVTAAITPWNFPAAMITRKAAPALAAGCTMVIKPSELTPLTALSLVELAYEAGIPTGVISVVVGDACAIGGEWMQDARVRKVSFTGSTAVGKILYAQSADTVKKLSLELGGNAPFIVFEDADIDAAVEGAMVSKYRNSGQTCVCANRFFVQASVYDAFVQKFSAKVKQLKLGNGLNAGVNQGPLINVQAIEKVEQHIEQAVAAGATVVCGGQRSDVGELFFEPTILSNVPLDALCMQRETFGPLAPIAKFTSESEMLDHVNEANVGLASYFYSKDMSRCLRVSQKLESGMVGVNTGLISNEVAPFGGVKESGLGREGSRHGISEYTEMKYVCFGGL